MKKYIVYSFFIFTILDANAQKAFPLVYKSAWPISVTSRYSNGDKTLALGGDMRAFSMMDATNGNILWTMEFKEKLGVKKAIDWGWEKDLGYVWVKIKTDEKGVEQTIYYDERTLEKIDDISKRKEKAPIRYRNSGWKSYTSYAGEIHDNEKNIHLSLQYKRKLIGSAIGKGTSTDITVVSTGAYNWTSTFQGRLIRSLCDNAVGSAGSQDFGGDYINMVLGGDRVYVIYEGISVFDLNSGKKLWETSFDNVDFNFGLLKSSQILGKAAMPLVGEDGVYIADLSKGNRRIKKFNPANGQLLWESESFGKDDIIPELRLVNGVLIARFGGKTEVQTYIPGTENRPDVCKLEYKLIGPYGIMAFDSKTGSTLWSSQKLKSLGDKFKGAITNMMVYKGNIVVASSKYIHCLDVKSGNSIFKTDLSKKGIGVVDYMWNRKGSAIIEGNAGIASVNLETGAVNFAAKTKKNFGTFGSEDALYVWVAKSALDHQNFIRVDMETGAILGIAKKTKYPQFDNNYEDFLKYDGNKVYRFRTK